jgi:hypothetical protein
MRHDPASGAIVIMLRSLKMHGMAQAVTDLIEQGAPAFEGAVPILTQLLKAEVAEREVRPIAYHMKAARFPAYKDLAGFDFAASEVNEATVRQLHRCEFLDGAHDVVLIGGPGTGKTHIASALGVQAVEHHRRKVRFFSTIELVNALEQEKTKGKAGQIAEGLNPPRPRDPRRARLPALQRLGRRAALPSPEQRMGHRLRRRQDDHRAPRPAHPPLPHPGDRQRQLPPQGQLSRDNPKKEGDQPRLEPKHDPKTTVRGGSLLDGKPGSVPGGNQQPGGPARGSSRSPG